MVREPRKAIPTGRSLDRARQRSRSYESASHISIQWHPIRGPERRQEVQGIQAPADKNPTDTTCNTQTDKTTMREFLVQPLPHTLHAGLLQRVPHVRGPASIWKEIIWGPVTEPHRKKLQHHGHVPIATNRPSITPPTTSSSPTRTSRRTRPPAAPAGFPSSRMPSASSIAWETSPRRTGTKITKTSSQTSNTTEKW